MNTSIEKVVIALEDKALVGKDKPLSHKIRDEIANMTTVSSGNVFKIKKVLDHGDKGIIEEMVKERVTINASYTSLTDIDPKVDPTPKKVDPKVDPTPKKVDPDIDPTPVNPKNIDPDIDPAPTEEGLI